MEHLLHILTFGGYSNNVPLENGTCLVADMSDMRKKENWSIVFKFFALKKVFLFNWRVCKRFFKDDFSYIIMETVK